MFDWKSFMVAGAAAVGVALAGPVAAQDISGSPTYGTVNLTHGFFPDPNSIDLAAGGSIDASDSIGGSCRGMVASAPDVNLNYTAGSFSLYLSVTSDSDTTLVVNSPDGQWYCNDDYTGLDPAVVFDTPQSGLYNIWVGTYSSSAGLPDATLHISELSVTTESSSGSTSAGGGLDFTLTPNYGSTNLSEGFANDPHTVSLNAGGSVRVADHIDGCYGYASAAPDYSVTYTAGDTFPLYFSAVSDNDTTLIINDPSGNWVCDDDGGEGLNPQVVFNNPTTGRYDVWVGTFFTSDTYPAATLYVSELGLTGSAGKTPDPTDLDWTLDPTFGSVQLTAGFTPDPHTVVLNAGGTIDASVAVDSTCRGYVAEAPDYDVYYDSGTWPLYFSVTADRDTTLVLRAPDGQWYCDDDDGDGLNPQIVFDNPQSGLYDVWVGVYSGSGEYPQATLAVSEIGATADNPGGTSSGGSGGSSNIDWTGGPSYGEVSLNTGFTPDPYVVSLAAGGDEDASGVSSSCWGNVATNPDFNLNFTAGSLPLFISASSSTDTTILVNAPDGQWYCSDDYAGLNPAVEFTYPQSGLYNIWVGTYSDQPDYPPATLFISEIEPHF
jgi:hypothetical protein